MNSNFSSEDLITSEEPSPEYTQGGYCALDIGDTLMSQYFLIRKLGWGFSSTVWLCWNLETQSYVAVKIMKASQEFLQITENEVDLLIVTVSRYHEYRQHVVKYLDYMTLEGENGQHPCIVFELAGQTLAEFKARNQLDLKQVKMILRQLLKGLFFLHEICDLVHTDLKQDNILILTSENLGQELALEVYESLFDTNVPRYFTSNLPRDKRKFKQPTSEVERASFEKNIRGYHKYLQRQMEHLGVIPAAEFSGSTSYSNDSYRTKMNSGDFRKPKNLCSYVRPQRKKQSKLGEFTVKIADLGYSIKNEVFQHEYIQVREFRAAEVILGGRLSKAVDIWSTACIAFELATGELLFDHELDDFQHIQKITQILGDVPEKVLKQSRHRDIFFGSDGKLLNKVEEKFSLPDYLQDIGFPASEIEDFSDFILSMLKWDVDERLTSAQCLHHSWFHK